MALRPLLKYNCGMDSGFGRRLAKARKERNVTQAQLASILGCTQEMVAMTERGTRNPAPGLAGKISQWISQGGQASSAAPRGAYS